MAYQGDSEYNHVLEQRGWQAANDDLTKREYHDNTIELSKKYNNWRPGSSGASSLWPVAKPGTGKGLVFLIGIGIAIACFGPGILSRQAIHLFLNCLYVITAIYLFAKLHRVWLVAVLIFGFIEACRINEAYYTPHPQPAIVSTPQVLTPSQKKRPRRKPPVTQQAEVPVS